MLLKKSIIPFLLCCFLSITINPKPSQAKIKKLTSYMRNAAYKLITNKKKPFMKILDSKLRDAYPYLKNDPNVKITIDPYKINLLDSKTNGNNKNITLGVTVQGTFRCDVGTPMVTTTSEQRTVQLKFGPKNFAKIVRLARREHYRKYPKITFGERSKPNHTYSSTALPLGKFIKRAANTLLTQNTNNSSLIKAAQLQIPYYKGAKWTTSAKDIKIISATPDKKMVKLSVPVTPHIMAKETPTSTPIATTGTPANVEVIFNNKQYDNLIKKAEQQTALTQKSKAEMRKKNSTSIISFE